MCFRVRSFVCRSGAGDTVAPRCWVVGQRDAGMPGPRSVGSDRQQSNRPGPPVDPEDLDRLRTTTGDELGAEPALWDLACRALKCGQLTVADFEGVDADDPASAPLRSMAGEPDTLLNALDSKVKDEQRREERAALAGDLSDGERQGLRMVGSCAATAPSRRHAKTVLRLDRAARTRSLSLRRRGYRRSPSCVRRPRRRRSHTRASSRSRAGPDDGDPEPAGLASEPRRQQTAEAPRHCRRLYREGGQAGDPPRPWPWIRRGGS